MRRLWRGTRLTLTLVLVLAGLPHVPTAAVSLVASSGRVDNSSEYLRFAGSWTTSASLSKDSGGTLAVAKVTGDSATLTFDGTGIRLVGRTGPSLGIAHVLLDGVVVASVDGYSTTQLFQQVLFERRDLPAGIHDISIVRTGSRGPISSGNDITVDALDVLDSDPPAAPASLLAQPDQSVVRLTWGAVAVPDLASYRVYRSSDGSAQTLAATVSATEIVWLDTAAMAGTTYEYTVSAIDSSGNESAQSSPNEAAVDQSIAAGPAIVENTDSMIFFAGSWESSERSGDRGGSATVAKVSGDLAHLAFIGDTLRWIARTGPSLGKARVSVDGAAPVEVDTYSPVLAYQQVVFEASGLGGGFHTIAIWRTGTRSAASTGNDVVLDAIEITGSVTPPPPTSVEVTMGRSVATVSWIAPAGGAALQYRVSRQIGDGEIESLTVMPAQSLEFSDPTVPVGASVRYELRSIDAAGNESVAQLTAYVRLDLAAFSPPATYQEDDSVVELVGDWRTSIHSSDIDGASANAKITGDFAQLAFYGSGVRWIGRTGPSLGIARIYIDDLLVATKDLYSATQRFQVELFAINGLSEGPHKFRVVRTGTRSTQSSGNDIVLDAVRVVDSVPPAAPRDVSITESRGGALATWAMAATPDLAGFRVYRALGQGAFDAVSGGQLLTEGEFLDIGLETGQSYRFVVVAVDSSGNQSPRSKVSTFTQPAPATPRTRLADCPGGGTSVATIGELRDAVAQAVPGTVIRLQPGIYAGGITVGVSGTPGAPIWICGPPDAVLDNGNVESKNAIHFSSVSYVNVAGLTIRNFRKGIVVSASHDVSISDLRISEIGEEAIKVRYGSTGIAVLYNRIRNTGRAEAVYGEGIYIGTSPKDWCAVYSCQPDRSDGALVVGNDIADTTADPIEAKPGTTGGTIRENIIDGSGLVAVTTLMAIKGNGYIITANDARNGSGGVGIFVGETEIVGYGRDNLVSANRVSVPAGSTAVFVRDKMGNVVDCTNVAVIMDSLRSNVTCQK